MGKLGADKLTRLERIKYALQVLEPYMDLTTTKRLRQDMDGIEMEILKLRRENARYIWEHGELGSEGIPDCVIEDSYMDTMKIVRG